MSTCGHEQCLVICKIRSVAPTSLLDGFSYSSVMFLIEVLQYTYMEALRENFLKVYANIPLGLREDIILVMDGKSLTWNVAYLEVRANTEMSLKILQELRDLKLI